MYPLTLHPKINKRKMRYSKYTSLSLFKLGLQNTQPAVDHRTLDFKYFAREMTEGNKER